MPDISLIISIFLILIFVIMFIYIKRKYQPISFIKAFILALLTVGTCGIALLLYKSVNHVSYGEASSSNNSYINTFENSTEKSENVNVASSYTDNFGKTTYYDEQGNIVGTGISDGFGKTTITDEKGDYVGNAFNNGLGQTTYTDKDGNVVNSHTNSFGDETFSDGTTGKSDSFGNKYYN